MLTVLLAIGAALGWGTADFLGGLKSRTMPMLAVLLISQLAAMLLLAVTLAVIGEPPPAGRFILYAVIAGLAETVGVAALYRGLSVGTMSIVAPVASVAPALPLVAGLLIGEVPGKVQSAGLLLAVAGVILTSYRDRNAHHPQRHTTSSTVYGLLSALGFGAFFVALDAASDGDVPWALFVARASSVTAMLLVAAAARFRPAARRADLPLLVLIGLLIVAADAMYATATTIGLLGVVAVIGALHTVVTVALARLVLDERMERLQRYGVAACIAGVLIISAAQ